MSNDLNTPNMKTKRQGEATPRKRGFASMDPDQQRKIASVGGRAAHQSGNAHQFDSAEAREAGRKGGEAVSRNREHMAEIGRAGGTARAANLQAKREEKEREEKERRERESSRDATADAGNQASGTEPRLDDET